MSDFVGTWDATLLTPIGTLIAVFEITETDGRLGGTAATKDETVEILDAAVADGHLTWIQHVTTPMKLTLKFDVTVEGDEMTGSYKAGILPTSKVNATRRH